MSDPELLERIFAHSIEISWAEQQAIIRHCFWSQHPQTLLDWLRDTPNEDLLIHIAGPETGPVVLEVHPDGPITELEGPSIQQALASPEGRIDIVFQTVKSEVIRIISEQDRVSEDERDTLRRTYTEFTGRRFARDPFVYLTVGRRCLPIRVPSTTS